MEILEGDALQRMLLQRYSKDPRGWSFAVYPSANGGFFDALVGSPGESWRLKLDTIFKPSPLVLGVRSEEGVPSGQTPSFGFRKVDQGTAPALLDDSPEGLKRLLAFLGRVSPVAPSTPGSYVQGPFLYSSQAKPGTLSQEQRGVDDRLSEEMRKLVRTRYPSYF